MAKLYFYYSAMNAGKSTVLLQSAYNYKERGMESLLLSPAIANRDGENKISSRIGLNAEAVFFHSDFDLYQYVKKVKQDVPKLNCILIDEAQFLKKHQVMQLTRIVDTLDIPVLAYGLRSDFIGEPFEGSIYLLVWADNIIEIKTICHCARKATMNARIDEHGNVVKKGSQIQIGGNESYISMCRKHFNDWQNQLEEVQEENSQYETV